MTYFPFIRFLKDILPFKAHEILSVDATKRDFKKLIETYHPRAIVTGTSMPTSPGGQLENKMRLLAREKNIFSVAILDHWSNYKERFLLRKKFNTKYLPDIFCIMDSRAKDEMLAEGFPESILKITGQPAFDGLSELSANFNSLRILTRQTMGLKESDTLIGFVSEPVKNDYENSRGYTEETVLSDLIAHILPSVQNSILGVKFHPREEIRKFAHLEKASNRVIFLTQFSSDQFLAASDIIIGMTSSLLIQAQLLGLKPLSYQPLAKSSSPHAKLIQPVPVITEIDLLVESVQDMQKMGSLARNKMIIKAAAPLVAKIIG